MKLCIYKNMKLSLIFSVWIYTEAIQYNENYVIELVGR